MQVIINSVRHWQGHWTLKTINVFTLVKRLWKLNKMASCPFYSKLTNVKSLYSFLSKENKLSTIQGHICLPSCLHVKLSGGGLFIETSSHSDSHKKGFDAVIDVFCLLSNKRGFYNLSLPLFDSCILFLPLLPETCFIAVLFSISNSSNSHRLCQVLRFSLQMYFSISSHKLVINLLKHFICLTYLFNVNYV